MTAPGGAGPDLSVVIPCTRPDRVPECLAALSRQPLADRVEVIIVGAVDGLVLPAFASAVVRVPCDDLHTNRRRNLGIGRARAPLVAFLDDDVTPLPGWTAAALRVDPEGDRIVAGPELPVTRGPVSELIYAVCRNRLTEADRAHYVTTPCRLRWTEAPFCNLVVPRRAFALVGLPAEDVPWDVDDVEFCDRARRHFTFHNVPELLIRHDRYPESLSAFLAAKWHRRLRTGQKFIEYPRLYLRKPPVAMGVFLPWAGLAAVLVLPWGAFFAAALYVLLLLSQAPEACRSVGPRRVAMYWGLMVSVHVLSTTAVQAGLAMGVVARCRAGFRR